MDYQQKIKEVNPVTKKIFLIVVLTVALGIPLSRVENQIGNRKEFETVAQQEVAKGWGGEVSIASPVLVFADDHMIYPTTMETSIQVDSQEKKRGVFKVPVYMTTYRTKLSFPTSDRKISGKDRISFPVKPASAIQNFKIKELKTGKELKGKLMEHGIRITAEELPFKEIAGQSFEIEVSVRGTGAFTYLSDADKESVKMMGNWAKPQFINDVLPTESQLSADGYTATWNLNTLPNGDDGTRLQKSIGLKHLWIGSDYSMIEKAVKYGILFIAMTFILIFIVEFISKAKIHPLQYGLIGLSISVFYLLLLAISENLGFDVAYLISSLAVTGLIGFYVRGFINQQKFVRMILSEQVVLSGFFYLLLSLEESAFLIGSLGLFVALTLFMAITRKFDWYAGSFQDSKASQALP